LYGAGRAAREETADPARVELATAGDPGRAQQEHDEHDDRHAHEAGAPRQDGRAADLPLPLEVGEEDVDEADGQPADDRAEQAPHPADDQHRQGEEGQVEVDLVDVDRLEQVD
jgi:hypothetical protein